MTTSVLCTCGCGREATCTFGDDPFNGECLDDAIAELRSLGVLEQDGDRPRYRIPANVHVTIDDEPATVEGFETLMASMKSRTT